MTEFGTTWEVPNPDPETSSAHVRQTHEGNEDKGEGVKG